MSKRYKAIFFGTPEFAAISLEALISHPEIEVKLVITQPDRPAGRGGNIQQSDVKQLALKHEIPVFQPQSLRKELQGSLEKINEHGPFDIGVVIAFGQILPQAVLDVPRMGCVNIHGSILPRWRGAAPIQRAIISDDKQTGICLMKMDAGLDTGAVYSEEIIDIKPEDTFQTLHDSLARLGAALLAKDIVSIIEGKIAAVPQKEEGLTYASKITQADAKIDWNKSAADINNLVRGLNPFPSAFCFLNNKRVKIFKTRPAEALQKDCVPGQVSFTDKSRLEVTCKEGVLLLEELQLEGKKRMPVSEFLKGTPIDTNTKFS